MHVSRNQTIYTGASGIVLPVPNKLSYPAEFQDKSRLEYYASLFNSIEINSSFYKLPIAKTLKKWADTVPEYFKFTFKLWKQITHNQGLAYDPGDVVLFMNRISAVGTRMGCLLVQFPPSLSVASSAQLERLLADFNEHNEEGWKIAVEFRNRSWYEEDIYELLHQYHATMVIHDIPASATPQPEEIPDVLYLRFHGPNGGYRGSYPDDYLYEYAQYIKEWQKEGKSVFAYFNNTMGSAVQNLITMNKFIEMA